jgi:polysaccharide export outer membrane protein
MLSTRSAIMPKGDNVAPGRRVAVHLAALSSVALWLGASGAAQTGGQAGKPTPPAGNVSAAAPVSVPLTPDYVIGPEDVLTVVVWKETDVSGDVTVRPDGKISLPLLNDIHAAGLTPEQLRQRITEAAGKYLEEPSVTVVVKAINSRKVFVTGQVGKPGPYPLIGPTTVLQLIAIAGGLLEYADRDHITIVRTEANGHQVNFPFNYKDVTRRKNLSQNILLKPGDTIVVP